MSIAKTLAIIPAAAPIAVSGGGTLKPLGEALIQSAGAALVYGINLPAKTVQNSAYYGVVYGDGATTAWGNAALPCLDNANDIAIAALSAPASLQLVVLVNGVPIIRVGNDDTVGAGEFDYGSVADTLTFGSTYAAGTKIEVIVTEAADVSVATVLVADAVTKAEVYDIMGTATATATIFRS